VFIHHDQRREQTRLAADYSRSSTRLLLTNRLGTACTSCSR